MRLSLPVRVAAAGLAVAAAATLSPAPASGSAQEDPPPSLTWGVVPAGPEGPDGRAVFDYKLDPGAELVDHVAVSNHSTDDLTVAVYASDALTTSDGGFDLLPAAEPATGVGSWITLDAPELTVPARSRVLVPFRLSVPANATPGDHAGGLVASLATSGTDRDGGQVRIEHRVGARIYLRVSGELRPQLTVERADAAYHGTWNPFAAGGVTATYTVRNTGNVRLTGRPRLDVAGWFGLGRRSGGGEPLPEILPGGAYTVTTRADGVAPLLRLTTTVAVQPATVDDQPLDLPRAEHAVAVWAVPWPQAVLLVLIAGAATGWWWLRRRRERQLAARLAAAREQGRAEGKAETQREEHSPVASGG